MELINSEFRIMNYEIVVLFLCSRIHYSLNFLLSPDAVRGTAAAAERPAAIYAVICRYRAAPSPERVRLPLSPPPSARASLADG